MDRRHYSLPLYTSRGLDLAPDGTFRATGSELKAFSVESVAAASGGLAWYTVAPAVFSGVAVGNVAVPTGCAAVVNDGVSNPAYVVAELDEATNRIRLTNPAAVVSAVAQGTISIYAAEPNGPTQDQRSAMVGAIALPPGEGRRLKNLTLTPIGTQNIDLTDTREDVVECFVAECSARPFGDWVKGAPGTNVNVWRSGSLEQFPAPAHLSGVQIIAQSGAVPQPDQYPEGGAMFIQSVGPQAEHQLTTFARWMGRLNLLAVLPYGQQVAMIPELSLETSAPHLIVVLTITGNSGSTINQRAAARLSFTVEG